MKSTITLSRGATAIEINAPIYGYSSRILMAIEFTRRADGKTGRFDKGREFDTRFCEAAFSLPEVQAGLLTDFLKTDARGAEFQLLAHDHINPFGPDLAGGDRRFMARCTSQDLGNAGAAPWRHFSPRLTFAMSSAPPCSLPEKRSQGGNMVIDGVSGFRHPEEWPEVDTEYAVVTVVGNGGLGAAADLTDGGDAYTSTITATCNESMAARLVHQLTQITRANTFLIEVADGEYLFGRDAGASGTYYVELASPEIVVSHVALDRYAVQFVVRLRAIASVSDSSHSNSSQSSTEVSSSSDSSSDSLSSYSNSSSSGSVSGSSDSSVSRSSSSDSVSHWGSISWWDPPY